MVRLRKLATEFYSPDQIKENAILTMQYLDDMRRYQDYMDGDLSRLYAIHTAKPTPEEEKKGFPSRLDDVTGYHLYKTAGRRAMVEVNYFKTVSRAVIAAVFSDLPVALTDDEAVQKQWDMDKDALLKQARMAVDWLVAKGRGVLVVREEIAKASTHAVLRAADPAGYIPIKHRLYQDQVIGHALLSFSYEGDRLINTEIINQVAADIWVSEDDVLNSDGYISAPVNEIRIFGYNGGEEYTGTLGELKRTIKSRIKGLWTFGDDDSIYGEMESVVFNAIVGLTNARTSLTRDIRSPQIIPQLTDPSNRAADGTFHLDPVRPTIQIPPDGGSDTSSTFGYSEVRGPEITEAFLVYMDKLIEAMSYASGVTPEAIGENYMPQEPAAAFNAVRQAFIVWITDIRAALSQCLSEAWAMTGGPEGVPVGWEQAPYVDSDKVDDRVIKLLGAGLISVKTAQGMAHLPIEEMDDGTGREDSGNDGDDPGQVAGGAGEESGGDRSEESGGE